MYPSRSVTPHPQEVRRRGRSVNAHVHIIEGQASAPEVFHDSQDDQSNDPAPRQGQHPGGLTVHQQPMDIDERTTGPPASTRGRSRVPIHQDAAFQSQAPHVSRGLDTAVDRHTTQRGIAPHGRGPLAHDQRQTDYQDVNQDPFDSRPVVRSRSHTVRDQQDRPTIQDIRSTRQYQRHNELSSDMTANQDDPYSPVAPAPVRARGRAQVQPDNTRSLGPAKIPAEDGFSPSAFTNYVNDVKAKNGILVSLSISITETELISKQEAQLAGLRERCYNAESKEEGLAGRIDEYQARKPAPHREVCRADLLAEINGLGSQLLEAKAQVDGVTSQYQVNVSKAATR